MPNENEKQAAAKQAVKLVKDGMVVGLGSGSTSKVFIEELLKRVKDEHLNIRCIATSNFSKELAAGHIPFIDEALNTQIDITFDGADRIDLEKFHLIKGGGGALLREKLVAKNSIQNVVLVDHSKISTPLFGFPLPVEIVKFGYKSTVKRIEALGFRGEVRHSNDTFFVTDNGNYTFDIHLEQPIKHAEKLENDLKLILGVVEVGLFLDTATKVIIAYPDGTTAIKERS
jgi:ribose 5-phosphate isomerase A